MMMVVSRSCLPNREVNIHSIEAAAFAVNDAAT